jgi:hypothetical protein
MIVHKGFSGDLPHRQLTTRGAITRWHTFFIHTFSWLNKAFVDFFQQECKQRPKKHFHGEKACTKLAFSLVNKKLNKHLLHPL